MTIGKKYVVGFHESEPFGELKLDFLEFQGTFSYNGAYTSNVVVKKGDIAGSDFDNFTVTYYWAAGEEPDLTAVTPTALMLDAAGQVNSVIPNSVDF